MSSVYDAPFDHRAAPSDGFKFPTDYYDLEIESAVEIHSRAGNKGFQAVAKVLAPAEFEDSPVYLRFYVGHEDDPEAEDPLTWQRGNPDIGSKLNVGRMEGLLTACEVVDKADAQGTHPAKAFLTQLEGRKCGCKMGVKTNKKSGEEEQSYSFYRYGAREAGSLSNARATQPTGRGLAPVPSARLRTAG